MIKRILILLIILPSSMLRAQDEEDLTNKVLVQFNLQDFVGCIETCNQTLKLYPKNKDVYKARTLSYLILGDLKGAQKEYEIAESHGVNLNEKSLRIIFDEDFKLKFLTKFFYKDEKIYPELGYRPRYTLKDSLRGALRPERTCFDVTFYNLKLKIDPKAKTIAGTNEITFRVVQPTKRIQIDLFAIYHIASITWQNKSLTYHREYDAIFIDFPENLPVGNLETIAIEYSGKPQKASNPPWDGGFVWKKDKKGNLWDAVACEHLGASSWWPNKDHPSDESDSTLLTFIVPNGYDVISNGRLRSKTPVDHNYTSHTWFVSNPINNYDVTFYLGKYSHFSDTINNTSGEFPLDFYAMPYDFDVARKTFAQTKEILEYYEQAFGPFPFMKDKYGLIEAPYEGMENQGAIAYGNEFNKKDQGQIYLNRKYDYIIVHESAHEWWGNSVTASDMADIWLQEGFATYAEMMFIEHKYGYLEYLKEMKRKMAEIFNVWPVVQNYNVNENSFASNDCYTKGAVTLHNLRCLMDNDSLFFKLLKDFALKYEKKIVTTTDFTKMVNDYTGKNYDPFFKKFLYDNNLPVLKYIYRREGNDIVLKYQWDEVDKGFVMPFCIATNGDKSYKLTATTDAQEVVLKNASTFRFFTFFIDPDKAEHNGYTYYWTRCDNPELKN